MIGYQVFTSRLIQMKTQLKASWKDALLAGIAAAISWYISYALLGHPNPIFAAVTALICLAPGLTNRGQQSVYVLTGVLSGVLIGEATLLLPPMPTEIRIAFVSFAAMTIASMYAVIPAIVVQAGVSAVMVFAMGAHVAGFTRVIDVAVGSGVGIVFSQILFTPNPVLKCNLAVHRFFHELANNYMLAEKAIMNRDSAQANTALRSCGRTHVALIALITAIDAARKDMRWTLRGRMLFREVSFISARYDRGGIRLYAASLLFCEALMTALQKERDEPPIWLQSAIGLIVQNSLYLAGEGKDGQEFIMPDRSSREEPSMSWLECVRDLELIENTLARLYKSKTHKNRLQKFRRTKILDAVREEVKAHKKTEPDAPKD